MRILNTLPRALAMFATCSWPSLCKQSELQCWRRNRRLCWSVQISAARALPLTFDILILNALSFRGAVASLPILIFPKFWTPYLTPPKMVKSFLPLLISRFWHRCLPESIFPQKIVLKKASFQSYGLQVLRISCTFALFFMVLDLRLVKIGCRETINFFLHLHEKTGSGGCLSSGL